MSEAEKSFVAKRSCVNCSCEACPVHRVCMHSPDYHGEEAARVVESIHTVVRERVCEVAG